MAKKIIETTKLTESENLKLRIFQAKIQLRKMKIITLWPLFKQYYPNYNTKKNRQNFQLCLQTQISDELITSKLEKLIKLLKSKKNLNALKK